MTKKNWLLVVFLIAMVAIYGIWFTDWFKPKAIHIFHTVRQIHSRRHGVSADPSLIFGVEPGDLRLTEIKIVPLADFEKNPTTLPVWHLVTDSNSAPVKNFTYGAKIRGMRPYIDGARPALLDTNLVYRIFIKAGNAKGQHDFQMNGTPAENTTAENP